MGELPSPGSAVRPGRGEALCSGASGGLDVSRAVSSCAPALPIVSVRGREGGLPAVQDSAMRSPATSVAPRERWAALTLALFCELVTYVAEERSGRAKRITAARNVTSTSSVGRGMVVAPPTRSASSPREERDTRWQHEICRFCYERRLSHGPGDFVPPDPSGRFVMVDRPIRRVSVRCVRFGSIR